MSPTEDHIGQLSRTTYESALTVFPGGVTRNTIERDPSPRYMRRGQGQYVFDLDDRRFLDLTSNFTALIHGHCFPPVVEALTRQLSDGTCFANPTYSEIELASLICDRIPGIDWVRFANTGTEAVMFAIKTARAVTGKSGIAKFEGAYHGGYDWVEVSQASTPQTWGDETAPSSTPYYRAMPRTVLDDVVPLRFNDAEGVERLLTQNAHKLAAIVIDVMPSRSGLMIPAPGFLAAVRSTAERHNILVIADEVLNLRQGYEGSAARYGLKADIFALGKIIGGGLPIGAVGGSREIMGVFEAAHGQPPLVPQGGTFAANPLSMTAGFVAMLHLDRASFERLEAMGDRLRSLLRASITKHDAPMQIAGAASLFKFHPKRKMPTDFRGSYCNAAESEVLRQLGRHFARHGVLAQTAAVSCLSTPMTEADIDYVAQVFDDFLGREAALFDGL